MYVIIILFVILVICAIILPKQKENFEQVKIRLKQNPLNINVNNSNNSCGPCSLEPDVIVPVYAPWRTYWPASTVYPYYPFYPYYYNNYY
jgi:hypothetical protein